LGVEVSATTYKELCSQSKDGIRFFQFPLQLRRRRLQEKKGRVGKRNIELSSSVILWEKSSSRTPRAAKKLFYWAAKTQQKQHPTPKYTKP